MDEYERGVRDGRAALLCELYPKAPGDDAGSKVRAVLNDLVAERDALRATLRALVDLHSPASRAEGHDVVAYILRRHPGLGPAR
jgi:hypothetical protein